MSTTYKLIEKVTVTSGVSSVNLGTGNTIPQTYTDLLVVCTVRSSTNADPSFYWSYNGDGSAIYSARFLRGTGSAASSFSQSAVGFHRSDGGATGTGETADTFSSVEILIADYTGSSSKSASLSMVSENNATTADITCGATLYASSNPITLINLSVDGTLAVGSTFYLYGVSRVAPNVVATGGTVTTIGGYRFHTFTSTSSFVVSTPGTVEYLVVGGGGGGPSGSYGGGGGAGGLLSGALSVTAQTYTVTIGGGGAGSTAGSNSVFAGLTAIGGGKGNDTGGIVPAGGSGGGGAPSSFGAGATAGLGTAGQGNAGGNGTSGNSNTGGGGGAAAAGAAGSGSVGGAGGAGTSVFGTVYAGGGAGAGSGATVSTGGSGGGGNTGQPGTANTGGGGGGSYVGGAAAVGGAGGSGIVIIRYPV